MLKKLACLVFMILPFLGKTQDSSTYSAAASFQYHPQDFFFQVHGQKIKNRLSQDIFIGFGITNTILQGQFKPRVGYDLSYRFPLIDWLVLAPLARFSYSFLSTKIPEKHPFIHLTEGFLGGRLDLGKKNRLVFAGGIGPAIEWKYDAYYDKRTRFLMWNYFAEIGFYHAF